MSRLIRNRYYFSLDILFFILIPPIALLLRLDMIAWSMPYLRGLAFYTVLSLIAKLPVFYRYGLYSRFWRYASVDELLSISSAVGVAVTRMLFVVMVLRLVDMFPEMIIPLSLPLIDGLLTLVTVSATRFGERSMTLLKRKSELQPPGPLRRIMVVGAGDAGSLVVREMQESGKTNMEPVAFVDDDAEKQGLTIHGVPVMGTTQDIARLAREHKIHEIVIAMPTASGKTIREIVASCKAAGVSYQTMPGMYDILSGKVGINHLRHVQIEDLLRRYPVKTDMISVSEFLRGKRVMVTGGGGSIGSELCRQILRRGPSELLVLGHGENSVFEIMEELSTIRNRMTREQGMDALPSIRPVIADIRFRDRIFAVFKEHKPDIVFHAAAHKHVPLMELNASEAVTNNILGTKNVLDACIDQNIQNFVLISTDKAVNPSSIMGACKRVAELLTRQAAVKSGKSYVAVRFGNVLGSRGSVVLSFRKQIAQGGPITVTHPDMERYFMVIPEAVQLVLQAAVLGRGGEVFMLDMGEPVKIADLARDMIKLSGLELDRDIEIRYSGIRPGEKLREELFNSSENYEKTAHEKIMLAAHASRTMAEHLDEEISLLANAAQMNEREEIVTCLNRLIPEYKSTGFNPSDATGVIIR